eukprot:comp20685_c0_seq1/m.26918 comp20685_c0_seq1/g.26918  ORF comp20685_c0_seq1/g.26918 comp20685_c0_seq1/m.26918 type:complete len:188 (-) comp20685_c0_seq1:335-898(-)
MADGNALNDFFAKKDKKKGVKKGATPVASVPPAVLKPTAAPNETAPAPTVQDVPVNAQKQKPKEDDGWVVPEEKVKDYSGLRIQELVIKSDDEEEKTIEYDEEKQVLTKKAKEKKTWAPTPKTQQAAPAVNTWQYPTLAATKDMGKPAPPGLKGFDTVKNGYRGDTTLGQAPKVALTNKFAGLTDDN